MMVPVFLLFLHSDTRYFSGIYLPKHINSQRIQHVHFHVYWCKRHHTPRFNLAWYTPSLPPPVPALTHPFFVLHSSGAIPAVYAW